MNFGTGLKFTFWGRFSIEFLQMNRKTKIHWKFTGNPGGNSLEIHFEIRGGFHWSNRVREHSPGANRVCVRHHDAQRIMHLKHLTNPPSEAHQLVANANFHYEINSNILYFCVFETPFFIRNSLCKISRLTIHREEQVQGREATETRGRKGKERSLGTQTNCVALAMRDMLMPKTELTCWEATVA